MKYAQITIDATVLEAETSSITWFSTPRPGYTKFVFNQEPTLVQGAIGYLTQEEKLIVLIIAKPIKMKFSNTSIAPIKV